MPKKLERCIDKLKLEGEKNAYAICNAAIKDAMFSVVFADKITLDNRTVVSVRDGVQKYCGAELGLEPPEKEFAIYRAPETIKAISELMAGLPMTDGHVSLDENPGAIIGTVLNSAIHDSIDETTKSTVKIVNEVELNDEAVNTELSLGYRADLIPCDLYDFEQVNIEPHHLAIVAKGRCGATCNFKDEVEKMPDINKAFKDAEGEINMQQVLDLVTNLPDVVKTMPLKELQKLAKLLTKAMAVATAEIVNEAETPAGETPAEGTTPAEVPAVDVPAVDMEKEESVPVTDSVEFKDALESAIKKSNQIFSTVVIKAKDFLPDTYDFADKSADVIMADALATQHTDKFEDAELPTAFKLLKKNTSYANFGKTEVSFVDELADKEL